MRCLLNAVLYISLVLISQLAIAAQASYTLQQLMQLGEKNYGNHCAACHQKDGTGLPLDAPPLRKNHVASSYVTTDKPILKHLEIVLMGVPGTTMVGFKNVLTPLDLASIITYERNAWGNNTGDVVQPDDIIKALQAPKIKNIDYNKQYSLEHLMRKGERDYRIYCARCHQLDGKGKAPHGPKLAGSYVASDPELIRSKINLVLEGAPGTRMRGYAKQLNDLQLAAILTYIANAWNNNGNQLIQPVVIRDARQALSYEKPNDDPVKLTLQRLMQIGRVEYKASCARCHLLDGSGHGQPSVPPLKNSNIVTKQPINNHIDIVLTGVPGSIMRAFAPRLSNLQLAAIVTYERNAWGNNTGDIVQAAMIQAERIRLHDKIEYQKIHQLQQQYVKDMQKKSPSTE